MILIFFFLTSKDLIEKPNKNYNIFLLKTKPFE